MSFFSGLSVVIPVANDEDPEWLTSLISVAFCDVYVRLCAMGIWHDLRIL